MLYNLILSLLKIFIFSIVYSIYNHNMIWMNLRWQGTHSSPTTKHRKHNAQDTHRFYTFDSNIQLVVIQVTTFHNVIYTYTNIHQQHYMIDGRRSKIRSLTAWSTWIVSEKLETTQPWLHTSSSASRLSETTRQLLISAWRTVTVSILNIMQTRNPKFFMYGQNTKECMSRHHLLCACFNGFMKSS